MHDHRKSVQDPRIRSPPALFAEPPFDLLLPNGEKAGAPMTHNERLASIQEYVWTLELLAEALVVFDENLENGGQPLLNMRCYAGIHQAVRTLIRQAGELCGALLEPDSGG